MDRAGINIPNASILFNYPPPIVRGPMQNQHLSLANNSNQNLIVPVPGYPNNSNVRMNNIFYDRPLDQSLYGVNNSGYNSGNSQITSSYDQLQCYHDDIMNQVSFFTSHVTIAYPYHCLVFLYILYFSCFESYLSETNCSLAIIPPMDIHNNQYNIQCQCPLQRQTFISIN